jgi:hypothetical protein
VESLALIPWNHWHLSHGIIGTYSVEWWHLSWGTVALIPWNTQNQKEFEISNQTFTQIVNVNLDTINYTIKFDIISIGKFAIQLIKGIFGVEIKKPDTLPEGKRKMSFGAKANLTTILVSGTQHPITIKFGNTLPPEKYVNFRIGTECIYFGGIVKFENLSTNKKYEYTFIFRTVRVPQIDYELIYAKTARYK